MTDTSGGRKLMYIAFFSFVIIGLPNGALNVAWIYMQATYGLALDSLGVLLGAITIGRLLLSVYSGRLIAQTSLGNYLIAGSGIMLAGLLGFMLAPSWPLLVVAGLAFGLGSAVLNTGMNTFAAAHFSPSRMNWLHAWYGVGSALGPLLVTFTVIDLGQPWQLSYAVLSALELVLVVLLGVTLREWYLAPKAADGIRPDIQRVKASDTLKMSAAWFGIILFFLHGGIQVGTGQLSNSLLTEARGIDPRVVGTWISIYWACLTAGRITTGVIVDRIDNAVFIRACMLGTIIGSLLLWWGPNDILSFAGLALMGFTLGPILPTLLADTTGRVGLNHAPNTIGFQIASSGVGLALLPGVAAVIAENFGLETIGPFLLVLAVLSFGFHELLVSRERQNALAVQV